MNSSMSLSLSLQQVFNDDIVPYLEAQRTAGPVKADQAPLFVSVGGQPGAGKGAVLDEVHRSTPGEHHDVAAAAVPGTVSTLVESGLVDRVIVQDRAGRVFHDAAVSRGGRALAWQAAQAVERARDVSVMSPTDARRWLSLTEAALRDRAELGQEDPDLRRVMSALASQDAAAVAAWAYPEDPAAQRDRLADLQRLSPERGTGATRPGTVSFPSAPSTAPPPVGHQPDWARRVHGLDLARSRSLHGQQRGSGAQRS